MDQQIPSAPMYPTLTEHKIMESQEMIYQLNKTHEFVKELNSEKLHYDQTYKRYRKLHKSLHSIQLFFQSVAVVTGGVTCGTVASGIGAIAAIPLGALSISGGIMSILFGAFDQISLKKLEKHSKLVQLCNMTDNEIM